MLLNKNTFCDDVALTNTLISTIKSTCFFALAILPTVGCTCFNKKFEKYLPFFFIISWLSSDKYKAAIIFLTLNFLIFIIKKI